jgi:hypothetical protein
MHTPENMTSIATNSDLISWPLACLPCVSLVPRDQYNICDENPLTTIEKLLYIYNILLYVYVRVLRVIYKTCFGLDDWIYYTFYIHNSGVKAITALLLIYTHFRVHLYTRARVLSLH